MGLGAVLKLHEAVCVAEFNAPPVARGRCTVQQLEGHARHAAPRAARGFLWGMRWGATPSRPHCHTEQNSGFSQDALKKRHNRKINTALKPAGVTTTTEKVTEKTDTLSSLKSGRGLLSWVWGT